MTGYTELPDDVQLDAAPPASAAPAAPAAPSDSAPQPVAVKMADGRWLLDPGATVSSSAPADGSGAGQGNGSGLVDLPADAQLDAPKVDAPTTWAGNIGLGARDILGSIGQGLNFLQTPTAAVWSALGGQPEDYEKAADRFADTLGLPRVPTDGHIGSAFRRGLGLGVLTAGAATPLAEAGGATGAIAKTLAATPVADAVSTGTSAAAGEAAKEDGANPWVQLGASLVGGLAGSTAAVAPGAIRSAFTAPRVANDLAQAYARQDVRMLPAAVGGTGTQMASGVTHMTLGGIPLAEAAEKSIATAQAARNRIAGQIGDVADTTGAGLSAQAGAKTFIDQTADRGGKLYDAIPIAANKPSILSNTKQALADLNSGLESNPELSSLLSDSRLQAYEKAIAGTSADVPTGLLDANGNPITRTVQKGGQLSWQDLKSFRSYIGELAGRPTLQDSTSKDNLQRLYAALSQDMQATASADGPRSLAAFNRANTFWRARQARIDNVMTAILGRNQDKGGQAAFNQIQSWATNKGDAIKLGQLLRSLPDEEANTVRASVFGRLGQAGPGRQGVEGDTFSPADFMTHWNALSGRAKAVLFPGMDYRNNIDDLVKIAGSMKDSAKYANTSKTSLGTNALALLGAFFSNPLYALGIGGTQFSVGKLLSSPRFAAWLASAPRKPNGSAALAHINRLTAIATAEPQLSHDILSLQQRLASAYRQAPMQAAASPDSQGNQ